MRVLVTGAGGFVGQWLVAELNAAGHEVVGLTTGSRPDIKDSTAVSRWIAAAEPNAVMHLAAIARPLDVDADPLEALSVAVAGTANVIAALAERARARQRPILLVAGSSEVYGSPEIAGAGLAESVQPHPRTAYGMTKLAQESVALSLGSRAGLSVVVTRSFNHIGPGQRQTYAIPAFAERILAARRQGSSSIRVGNLDLRRDITDVRDVVVAYRLLLELAAEGGIPEEGLVVNVGSGRTVTLREVVERLARIVGATVIPVVDDTLVRPGEPGEILADVTRLKRLTGWRPITDLDVTLADVVQSLTSRDASVNRSAPQKQ